jgi:hypothetical protein
MCYVETCGLKFFLSRDKYRKWIAFMSAHFYKFCIIILNLNTNLLAYKMALGETSSKIN